MNKMYFAQSAHSDAGAAGEELAQRLRQQLGEQKVPAILVFASSRYDYGQLLARLMNGLPAEHLIGCSSAGEFVGSSSEQGSCCAVAWTSDEATFSSAVATGLSREPRAAAHRVSESLRGMAPEGSSHVFRTGLVFCDALAGNTEEFIEELTRITAGQYQLVGGGAGDDAQFSRTHVFYRGEACTDAVVLLEVLSDRPLGIGVSHGWKPTGDGFRVTDADGMKLVSLNAEPAVQAFRRHAEETGQTLDVGEPIPFFLHNVLGIKTPLGWKLRVPLSFNEDGSVNCASEIPRGSTVSFMKTSLESSAEAAEHAINQAREQLGGDRPGAALFFDCVATRLRMGSGFGLELEAIREALGGAAFAGYNTYGQIARAEGQFGGFHNCTAVVCLIPE